MSKVTILRGVSGSGKSTYAATNYPGALVVSADSFFAFVDGYKFDPTKLSEAHGLCLRGFVDAAQRGRNVVVDNTNITVEEIAPYYAIAEAYGREVEIVTFDVPISIAHARNIHNVPLAKVEGQHFRLWKAILPPRWNHRVVRNSELTR